MAVLELAIVVVAFGAMAIVFGLQERAERRRLIARAEADLASERSPATLTFEQPARPGLRRAV
jgi:hypothetical protein